MRQTRVPIYRALVATVRPPRIAVLFQVFDHWPHTITRIIENLSTMWGGAGNLLIPVDRQGKVHPIFMRVLSAFDPDYIASYGESGLDLKIRDLNAFIKIYERRKARLIEEGFDSSSHDHFLEREVATVNYWDLNESTTKRIMASCAPFHYNNEVVQMHLSADGKLPYQLTNVSALKCKFGSVYTLSRFADDNPMTNLLLIAKTGKLSEGFKEELSKIQTSFPLEKLTHTEQGFSPIISDMSPRPHINDWPYEWETTPFGHTMSGCGFFLNNQTLFKKPSWTIIVGSSAEDFCLAYDVGRLSHRCTWLPDGLANDDQAVENIVRNVSYNGRIRTDMAPPFLASLSWNPENTERFCEKLRKWNYLIPNVIPQTPTLLPIGPVLRIYDEKHSAVPMNQPFVGRTTANNLDTPIPSIATNEHPNEFKWITDILTVGYKPPLTAKISGLFHPEKSPDTTTLRCSERGLSYFSQRALILGSDTLQSAIARPRFQLPNAKQIFRKLMSDSGLSINESDKGRFSKGSLRLWGGLNQASRDLLQPPVLSFLLSYLQPKKEGHNTPGWFIEGTKRRFLSFVDAVLTCKLDQVSTRDLLDRFLRRSILTRGFILVCPYCSDTAWHPLSQVGSQFDCRRCQTQVFLTSETWKESREPRIYYALNEVLYQMLRHNGHLPLMTLAKLKKGSESFAYCYELALYKNRHLISELDLAILKNGEIWIGEVKIADKLAEKAKDEVTLIDSLMRTAEKITAHAVVFGTAAPQWREATKQKILAKFQNSVPRPVFVENIMGEPTLISNH